MRSINSSVHASVPTGIEGVVGTGTGVGTGFGVGVGVGVGTGVGSGTGVGFGAGAGAEGVSTEGVEDSSVAGTSVSEELSLQLKVKNSMRISSFFINTLSCLMSFQVKEGKFVLKVTSILLQVFHER